MTKNKIYKGAFVLGIGTFVAKILGAVYRIPLTNIIGGYGLGLYQMVFPVYCTLLDFSGAGAPSAISKIISSYPENERVVNGKVILEKSKKFFLILGLVGSLIMLLFSNFFAKAQGDGNATYAYVTLSPAIVFVCLLSCYRGYFQGLMQMSPTAISQIIEQFVKIVLGLTLVTILSNNVNLAVSGSTLAVTVAEICCLIFLKVLYKKSLTKSDNRFCRADENFQVTDNSTIEKSKIIKRILKYLIPITLIGIAIPVSQVIDSFIIVNILNRYNDNATVLYGLFTGVACTIMNLPVSVCYGIAGVAIPAISGEREKKAKQKNVFRIIFLTLLLSVPCALICYFFAPQIIDVLFSKLQPYEKEISVNLLKIVSLGVVFLSLLQSTNAILIGKDKQYYPLISMSVGIALKLITEFWLLPKPDINIYGGAIGLIACYFVANLINLVLIFTERNKNGNQKDNDRQFSN